MRYFYDTEFLEDGRTIELISIGIIAEDGREYYAVNAAVNDRDLEDDLGKRISRHDWLMENVVPHLPLRIPPARYGTGGRAWMAPALDMSSTLVKPKWVIANEVLAFLHADSTERDDNELWAWYGAYDHVVLCQLWGRMIDLPSGVPMWTNDLKQEVHRRGNPRMPEQVEGEHNALADARHVRDMFIALERES